MKYFFLFICIFWSYNSFSQKSVVDSEIVKNWKRIGRSDISNDGNYVWFEYLQFGRDSIVIVSIDGKYRRTFCYARDPGFSENGKAFFFITDNGMSVFDLTTKDISIIPGVRRYDLHKGHFDKWITLYYDKVVQLKNLENQKEFSYENGTRIQFGIDIGCLVLKKDSMFLIDLRHCQEKFVFEGDKLEGVVVSPSGQFAAFTCLNNQKIRMLYYYNVGEDSARALLSNSSGEFNLSSEIPWFSEDSKNIFFKILDSNRPKVYDINSDVKTDKVDIWHYKDKLLQSTQQVYLGNLNIQQYTAVVSVDSKKILILESDTTILLDRPISRYVLSKKRVDDGQSFWNLDHKTSYRLLDIKKGNSIDFMMGLSNAQIDRVSGSEKFAILRDPITQNLYSYEIETGQKRCITDNIDSPDSLENPAWSKNMKFIVAGWLRNDEALLVYDRYDIWLVSPKNIHKPISITANYGRKNRIILRLVWDGESLEKLKAGDSVLITGLEDKTKNNAFFKTVLGEVSGIKQIGAYNTCLYYFPQVFFSESPRPVKAKNKSVYLLYRQTDTDAPNLCVTTDFLKFKMLSFVNPCNDVNWMTAELIHWKMDDGTYRDGVLYKPEDFDAKKSYPIIFNYYEIRSNERYEFKYPQLSEGAFNIPWYVSRGYLVFVPDIWQKKGHTGESALKSVVSAAHFLVNTYPWIDSMKMGLQGHSFGGYETNYIICHSNMFAAAQSSAGLSNCISGYGDLGFGKNSLAGVYEVGQMNLGTTPWAAPNIYVENSPIFYVDKIVTPLLLLHNKGDESVPFAQSVELFTAMRRIGKVVWLLQYDNEGHTLDLLDKASIDFTIRQQQFFDHYLKNMKLPIWMDRGVPASEKGKISGLSLNADF